MSKCCNCGQDHSGRDSRLPFSIYLDLQFPEHLSPGAQAVLDRYNQLYLELVKAFEEESQKKERRASFVVSAAGEFLSRLEGFVDELNNSLSDEDRQAWVRLLLEKAVEERGAVLVHSVLPDFSRGRMPQFLRDFLRSGVCLDVVGDDSVDSMSVAGSHNDGLYL